MKILVIDFGGTYTKYSVMDTELKVYEKGIEASPLASREEYVEFVCAKYLAYERRHQIGGVAISMPGVIDEKLKYVRTGGAFLKMRNVSIEDLFKGRLLVPVEIENDGKCGALAELWAGNLSEVNDGVVLTLGTAIAGGIIKDRRIHKGNNLMAGEFSYLLLGEEKDFRSTAFYKCSTSCLLLRTYLKKHIDVRKNPHYMLLSQLLEIEQDLSQRDNTHYYLEGIDGQKFFELLSGGDEDIQELYQEYIYDLAKLVMNIQVLYAPEKILIGGGISKQSRILGDIMQQCERQRGVYKGLIEVSPLLERCKFGSEANQYGALYNFLVQNKLLKS